MIPWLILSIFLLIINIFVTYLLIRDNGIFASLVRDGMNLLRRDGLISAIKAGAYWLRGRTRNIFIGKDKSSFSDAIVHIAFHPTGGMGDYIISGSVLHEIRELYNCAFVIYCEKQHFGNAIYGGIDNVDIVRYTYDIFEKERIKYDVALEVEHFVHIRNWDKERVNMLTPQLAKKIEYIEEEWSRLYVNIPTQCYRERIQFERCKLLKLDRWTELRMGEAFSIDSKMIPICLLDSFRDKVNSDNDFGGEFITINYGCDAMVPGKKQLKMWSKDELERLISIIHENKRSISVVQLGARDAEKIPGVDKYVLGESLELIKWILKKSKLHIDCEGGLVHLATQLGTKCAVIFGPTPIWMYGYEQNINIVSDGCSGCMGLHENWAYECLNNNEYKECIRKIIAEDVYERIKDVL